MKSVIAEFRKSANNCREAARLVDALTFEDADTEIVAEAIDMLRDELSGKTLHQLDALLDREHDANVADKRKEIAELLEDGPAMLLTEWTDEDPETVEALDDLPRDLIVWSMVLRQIASRLDYVVASLSARPSLPSAVHHTTITNSRVGSVSVGNRSRAKGRVR
jgi:hypothetical protein